MWSLSNADETIGYRKKSMVILCFLLELFVKIKSFNYVLTRLKITEHPDSFEEMWATILSMSLDFVLTATDASTFVSYQDKMAELNRSYVKPAYLSKVIGYRSESHIAYRKLPVSGNSVTTRYRWEKLSSSNHS